MCYYCPLPFFIRDLLLCCTLNVVYLANIQFCGKKKNFIGNKFSKNIKRSGWIKNVGGGGGGYIKDPRRVIHRVCSIITKL